MAGDGRQDGNGKWFGLVKKPQDDLSAAMD